LNIEAKYLKSDKQSLVLLHGWGTSSEVWESWITLLEHEFSVLRIDLPGLGSSTIHESEINRQNVLNLLAKQIPENSMVAGWSLGGMLAILLANQLPKKIKGLVTIATNPCFLERSDWALGMTEKMFTTFEKSLLINVDKTLKRFFMLQVLGGSESKTALKTLQAINSKTVHSSLSGSLRLLREDVRGPLRLLEVPSLHIFGEKDQLAPVALCQQMAKLNPLAQVLEVAGAGHLPFISDPKLLADKLLEFSLLVKQG
jgi:pimeloyl-[acyl-carrier protein] methyl ester esterase